MPRPWKVTFRSAEVIGGVLHSSDEDVAYVYAADYVEAITKLTAKVAPPPDEMVVKMFGKTQVTLHISAIEALKGYWIP